MLKRFFAGLGRKPQVPPPDSRPDDANAAFAVYEAADLYPPHDFGPLLRVRAAQDAVAAFNARRFADARAHLDACAVGDVGARLCVALLRAHVLREELRFADALTELDRAMAIAAGTPRVHVMRCEILYCLGQFNAAQREFATIRCGAVVRGMALMGALLADARGDSDAAIRGYRDSLESFPHIAFARSNLGYALIRAGMHGAGYGELRRVGFETGFLPMERASPVWAGEPLDARPLLLVAEFGLGDMVQYLRYAGALQPRLAGTPLWLKAPHTLHGPAQRTGWFDRIIAPDVGFNAGFHLPLMQLPSILGMEADLRPVPFPYLTPDDFDVRRFAQMLGTAAALPLIGLRWAGKPIEIDARRSLPPGLLAPLLAKFSGRARFVSLQTGPAREQAAALPEELRPLDLADELTDVGATLALCTQLDLLISVDTAAAHIAGAGGTPVWLLSRPDVEWRWETRGEHDGQPVVGFYPGTRVFRHPGGDLDWPALLGDLSLELDAWLLGRSKDTRR